MMSMCGVFSCVVGRGCLLWPVCSLGKTLLAFALLNSVLQGQICLLLQVFLDHLFKAMFFPIVMYRCDSWAIKKAEHQIIDALELWFWRRLLRVPWRARRSNQSILKEISPEYSLEGRMLQLRLQYFDAPIHLMRRTDSLEKTLMVGKIESRRKRG